MSCDFLVLLIGHSITFSLVTLLIWLTFVQGMSVLSNAWHRACRDYFGNCNQLLFSTSLYWIICLFLYRQCYKSPVLFHKVLLSIQILLLSLWMEQCPIAWIVRVQYQKIWLKFLKNIFVEESFLGPLWTHLAVKVIRQKKAVSSAFAVAYPLTIWLALFLFMERNFFLVFVIILF